MEIAIGDVVLIKGNNKHRVNGTSVSLRNYVKERIT